MVTGTSDAVAWMLCCTAMFGKRRMGLSPKGFTSLPLRCSSLCEHRSSVPGNAFDKCARSWRRDVTLPIRMAPPRTGRIAHGASLYRGKYRVDGAGSPFPAEFARTSSWAVIPQPKGEPNDRLRHDLPRAARIIPHAGVWRAGSARGDLCRPLHHGAHRAVGGTEVAGGGYVRLHATFVAGVATNLAVNATTLEFPLATGNWGSIGHFELWDAITAG